jgi:hypothetical protein
VIRLDRRRYDLLDTRGRILSLRYLLPPVESLSLQVDCLSIAILGGLLDMTTMMDEREATEPQSPSVESPTCGTSVSSNVIASLTKAGERLAENAPPLTSEQVDRIVAILRLSDGDDAQLQHIA